MVLVSRATEMSGEGALFFYFYALICRRWLILLLFSISMFICFILGLVASKLFHFEERKFENLNVALMRFEWEGSLILFENSEKQ